MTSPLTGHILRRLASTGADAHPWSFLILAALEMLADAMRLDVTRADPDMTEVLALAVATGLTPYDASYLWLARERRLPLVTLDRALARAADAL